MEPNENDGKKWADDMEQVALAARVLAREDWHRGVREYQFAAARRVAVRVGRRLSQPEMTMLQRAYAGELHLLNVGQRLAAARGCPKRLDSSPCVDVTGKGCVFCGEKEAT